MRSDYFSRQMEKEVEEQETAAEECECVELTDLRATIQMLKAERDGAMDACAGLRETIKTLTQERDAAREEARGAGYNRLFNLFTQELPGIPEEDWPMLNSHYCHKLGRAMIRALKR